MRCLRTLPPQLEGIIEVIQEPYRTSFYSYEQIDLSGMKIRISMSGRVPITVESNEIEFEPRYFDNWHRGVQNITIGYSSSLSYTFPVTIMEQDVVSLEITEPQEIEAEVGEPLDFSSVSTRGVFEHFGEDTIPHELLSFSPSEGTIATEDMDTLVVSIDDANAQIPMSVVDRLSYIEVTASRTSYLWGDEFSTEGISVTAVYNEGEYSSEIPLSECTITPSEGDTVYSDFTVVVGYKGKSDSVECTVKDRLEYILIDEGPTLDSYSVEDTISYDGMLVLGYYNDGSKVEEIQDYEVTPSVLKEYMVDDSTMTFQYTVSYNGKHVIGTLEWDGFSNFTIEPMDWCPWEYREGFDVWSNGDMSYYCHGWTDDEGNTIRFPYSIRVEGLDKHNWEALGMHPKFSNNPNALGDGYYWVHDAGALPHKSSGGNNPYFVGSDCDSFVNEYGYISTDNLESVFLPYCDGDFKDISVMGKSGISIITNSFFPTEYSITDKGVTLTVEVRSRFQLADWEWTCEDYATNGTVYSKRATFKDGVREQTIIQSERTPVYGGYRYRVTFEDGYTESRTVPTEAPQTFHHVLEKSRMNMNITFRVNTPYVYQSLGEALSYSLPFITRLVVPIGLKDKYLEEYRDGMVHFSGYSIPLYFEEMDRWMPKYYSGT